jgi:hypothetical protein
MALQSVRLGVDIGGTFTDVVLEIDAARYSTKVLTTYAAPENAIVEAMHRVCAKAGISASSVSQIIHGTTLATNALIERRGAKTALITTQGFRDVIEMRTESRFEQYDLNLTLPEPLVARNRRYVVRERMGARGDVLIPLDRAEVEALADTLRDAGYQSIAVGLLHSYVNSAHERMIRDVLTERLPGAMVSISSEVSPQMREYERFNTTIANAYIKPLMKSYLGRLADRLKAEGADCPVFLMHSGGGIIDIATASEFPVRLVESGPAGGAVFAADIANGKDLPDQEPDAEDRACVRGGAYVSLQEGIGHADLDPRHRHGRDRRWRRQSRPCRFHEPDPRRAGKRRLGTGTSLLRSGRHAPGGDRCRPDPRQARSRQFRGRYDPVACRPISRGARRGARRKALDADNRGSVGARRGRGREHGQCRARSCGRKR